MTPTDPLAAIDDIEATTGANPNADDLIFELMLATPDPAELVLRYQQAELFVKQLAARRKAQNKRLQAVENAWELRKRQVQAKILETLEAVGIRGKPGTQQADSRKLVTMLGTTYRVAKKDWSARITDPEAALQVLRSLRQAKGESAELADLERDELVRVKVELTAAGRKAVEEFAVEEAGKTGELVAWAEVQPPGYTVATRLSGEQVDVLDHAAERLVYAAAQAQTRLETKAGEAEQS